MCQIQCALKVWHMAHRIFMSQSDSQRETPKSLSLTIRYDWPGGQQA